MANPAGRLPGLVALPDVVDDEEIPVAPNPVAVPPTTSPADYTSLTNPGVICW